VTNNFNDKSDTQPPDYLLKPYFKDAIENCEEILRTKNMEYSDNRNPFSNFTELAKSMNINPETVWYIYFSKGLKAIEEYCKTNETHSCEQIEHRIFDAINYLIILHGLIKNKK
jgi:hypothetical protein